MRRNYNDFSPLFTYRRSLLSFASPRCNSISQTMSHCRSAPSGRKPVAFIVVLFLVSLIVGPFVPLAVSAESTPDYSDMWWAGESENGWGMSITQHGSIQFIALYVYDNAGKPV